MDSFNEQKIQLEQNNIVENIKRYFERTKMVLKFILKTNKNIQHFIKYGKYI